MLPTFAKQRSRRRGRANHAKPVRDGSFGEPRGPSRRSRRRRRRRLRARGGSTIVRFPYKKTNETSPVRRLSFFRPFRNDSLRTSSLSFVSAVRGRHQRGEALPDEVAHREKARYPLRSIGRNGPTRTALVSAKEPTPRRMLAKERARKTNERCDERARKTNERYDERARSRRPRTVVFGSSRVETARHRAHVD